MINDYTTLTVGQKVAVARTGSWDTQNQGIYTVVKANKVKVVVARDTDGYERTFSVKKRAEMSITSSTYNYAYLETVEEQQARINRRLNEGKIRNAWLNVEKAAGSKNIEQLRQYMAELEQML
jgi:hypothetical protein